MPTIDLTNRQFLYLQAAVSRDLENLEDVAPWDIADCEEEHADEMRKCREMVRLLKSVEQTQLITH